MISRFRPARHGGGIKKKSSTSLYSTSSSATMYSAPAPPRNIGLMNSSDSVATTGSVLTTSSFLRASSSTLSRSRTTARQKRRRPVLNSSTNAGEGGLSCSLDNERQHPTAQASRRSQSYAPPTASTSNMQQETNSKKLRKDRSKKRSSSTRRNKRRGHKLPARAVTVTNSMHSNSSWALPVDNEPTSQIEHAADNISSTANKAMSYVPQTAVVGTTKRHTRKEPGARKQLNRVLVFALVFTQDWLHTQDLVVVPLVSSHFRAIVDNIQSPQQGVVVVDFCSIFQASARKACRYFVQQLYLQQNTADCASSEQAPNARVCFMPSTLSVVAVANKSTVRKHAQILPKNLAYLEHLDVSDSPRLKKLNALGVLIQGGRLQYLNVSNCDALTTMYGIETAHATLTQLDASKCGALVDISSIAGPTMRVEKLALQDCPILESEQVRLLCGNSGPANALISLDIGGCGRVAATLVQEGNVVEKLMSECPNLDYLNIANCDTLVEQVRYLPHAFLFVPLVNPLILAQVVDVGTDVGLNHGVDEINATLIRDDGVVGLVGQLGQSKKKRKKKKKKKKEKTKKKEKYETLIDKANKMTSG